MQRFDFGTTQSGTTIDDVGLPAWAQDDPRLFIKLHREALESDYVSQHLHLWIDLVFGYKQRGKAAVEATNCFHELSYDDSFDVHSIESSMERQAVLKTIHMFGVCPRQLFTGPHPGRSPKPASKPTITKTPWLLMQSAVPVHVIKNTPVHFIHGTAGTIKPFSSPRDYLILSDIGLSISIGHLDGSVRVFAKENLNAAKFVSEQLLPERISSLADASTYGSSHFGGGDTNDSGKSQQARVLLGSLGGAIIACQVDTVRQDLTFLYSCRGHTDAILALEHSHAWSLAVSGSQDRTAIIWDNQGNYVKSLVHKEPVQTVRICANTGLIATGSARTLSLWSVNGDAIASVSTTSQDRIMSLAFDHTQHTDETTLCTIMTGHRGKVIVWQCRFLASHDARCWALEACHVFEHRDRVDPPSVPLITAISVQQDTLYTGDELGRLYTWNFPGQFHDVAANTSMCMQCERKFGVFEKRLHCASCGGVFCSQCALTLAGSPFGPHRYCTTCRDILSTHLAKWLSTSP